VPARREIGRCANLTKLLPKTPVREQLIIRRQKLTAQNTSLYLAGDNLAYPHTLHLLPNTFYENLLAKTPASAPHIHIDIK
jgi:hypothetical protein